MCLPITHFNNKKSKFAMTLTFPSKPAIFTLHVQFFHIVTSLTLCISEAKLRMFHCQKALSVDIHTSSSGTNCG